MKDSTDSVIHRSYTQRMNNVMQAREKRIASITSLPEIKLDMNRAELDFPQSKSMPNIPEKQRRKSLESGTAEAERNAAGKTGAVRFQSLIPCETLTKIDEEGDNSEENLTLMDLNAKVDM